MTSQKVHVFVGSRRTEPYHVNTCKPSIDYIVYTLYIEYESTHYSSHSTVLHRFLQLEDILGYRNPVEIDSYRDWQETPPSSESTDLVKCIDFHILAFESRSLEMF